MRKIKTTSAIKAADQLSEYCFANHNPDGKCKCPFWETYPYGHCMLHKPLVWPMTRIKEMNK